MHKGYELYQTAIMQKIKYCVQMNLIYFCLINGQAFLLYFVSFIQYFFYILVLFYVERFQIKTVICMGVHISVWGLQ